MYTASIHIYLCGTHTYNTYNMHFSLSVSGISRYTQLVQYHKESSRISLAARVEASRNISPTKGIALVMIITEIVIVFQSVRQVKSAPMIFSPLSRMARSTRGWATLPSESCWPRESTTSCSCFHTGSTAPVGME